MIFSSLLLNTTLQWVLFIKESGKTPSSAHSVLLGETGYLKFVNNLRQYRIPDRTEVLGTETI